MGADVDWQARAEQAECGTCEGLGSVNGCDCHGWHKYMVGATYIVPDDLCEKYEVKRCPDCQEEPAQ